MSLPSFPGLAPCGSSRTAVACGLRQKIGLCSLLITLCEVSLRAVPSILAAAPHNNVC